MTDYVIMFRGAGYPGWISGLFPYPVSGRIPDIALPDIRPGRIPDIRCIVLLAFEKPAFIGIYWLLYGNNLFLASCRMLYYVWVVLKT